MNGCAERIVRFTYNILKKLTVFFIGMDRFNTLRTNFICTFFEQGDVVDKYVDKYLSGHTLILSLKEEGFHIFIAGDDRVIGRWLLKTGNWEPHVTLQLKKLLKTNSTFLDIGANIGYFSLLACKNSPGGKVICFEPDEKNFELLTAGISYNKFNDRITAYNLAVSDKNQTLVLTDLGNKSNYGNRYTHSEEEKLRSYVYGPEPSFKKVKAVALDNLLGELHIDIVKIDIEGYEPYAVEGMKEIINRDKPIIITELNPTELLRISDLQPSAYLTTFINLGYNVFQIEDNGGLSDVKNDISGLVKNLESSGKDHFDLLLTSTR